jgi:hypothetical protein
MQERKGIFSKTSYLRNHWDKGMTVVEIDK